MESSSNGTNRTLRRQELKEEITRRTALWDGMDGAGDRLRDRAGKVSKGEERQETCRGWSGFIKQGKKRIEKLIV